MLLLTCSAACSNVTLSIGSSPEILWWTDHEDGLADWTSGGGDRGGLLASNGGQVELSTEFARSGRTSLRSIVTSPGEGAGSTGVARRTGSLPKEAYYSAWYYVPEPMTGGQYWLFFKFRSRTVAADPATAVEVWDFDFNAHGDGTMGVFLYHHDTGDRVPLASPLVPLRRWFQVEAFFRAAGDATGRLELWFDGALIYDIAEPTAPSDYVEWQVGGVAEFISPVGSTLFVDDAAISTERLGPDYPVFWRPD